MRRSTAVITAAVFISLLVYQPAVAGWWWTTCPTKDVIEGATTPCGACRGVINDMDGYQYHLVFCTPQAKAGYEAAVRVGRARVIGLDLGFLPTPCDGDGSECRKLLSLLGDIGKFLLPYCALMNIRIFHRPMARKFIATYVKPIPPLRPVPFPELDITPLQLPLKRDGCGRRLPTFWEILLNSLP